jgi:hypothetical protein
VSASQSSNPRRRKTDAKRPLSAGRKGRRCVRRRRWTGQIAIVGASYGCTLASGRRSRRALGAATPDDRRMSRAERRDYDPPFAIARDSVGEVPSNEADSVAARLSANRASRPSDRDAGPRTLRGGVRRGGAVGRYIASATILALPPEASCGTSVPGSGVPVRGGCCAEGQDDERRTLRGDSRACRTHRTIR